MKRFHVHLQVSDLAASLAFYNKLFAAEPARVEADYAKWMLTDPQGVAWEQFHTLGDIPTFNAGHSEPKQATAQTCCAPAATKSENKTSAAGGGCCAPASPASTGTRCC